MLVAGPGAMSIRRAAVWLDHEDAKIFHIDADHVERDEVHIAHHLHRAHKTGGHAELHRSVAEEHPFFDDIAARLADAEEILVVGPADAKLEFVRFVQGRHKDVAGKIVGVEPSDHPTDGQIVAHVREYFRAADGKRS